MTQLIVIIAALQLLVGLWVGIKNPKQSTNRLFLLFSIFVFTWSFSNAILLQRNTDNQFWGYFSYLSDLGIFTSFLNLIWVFPEKNTEITLKEKIETWISTAVYGVMIYILSFDLHWFKMSFNYSLSSNWPLLIITILPIMLITFAFQHLKKTKNQLNLNNNLLQIRSATIFWGFYYTIAINVVTNLTLPLFGIYLFYWIGPFIALLFLVFIVYAMMINDLLDFQVIIRRTVIYTILLAFIFTLYSILVTGLAQIIQGKQYSPQLFLANLFGALIIGFSFEPVRNFLQKKIDRRIFQRKYQKEEVIKELSYQLNEVDDLDQVIEMVMQKIIKLMEIHRAITYIFQTSENGLPAIKHVKQLGYHTNNNQFFLSENTFIIEYFTQYQNILFVQDLKSEVEQEKMVLYKKTTTKDIDKLHQHAIKSATLKRLRALECNVAIPLQIKNQLTGLILLGEKVNGTEWTAQDISLIELIASQTISAIERASLFEGDQIKSEFISIASHELLTPISAIEGYLSMIIDEHIGYADKEALQYLDKVYLSAQRLSILIRDLLTVSRLESGHLKINPQSLDLEKMIEESMGKLKNMASSKKIKLIYEKQKVSPPPVWADLDRTMDVLVNLLNNAIKYTIKGSVSININYHFGDPYVSVSISDTGIGLTADQVNHLFSKFYRVESSQTVGILGTGLGLYITKVVLEKMGGNIQVKSVPNQGSTFTFTLPIFQVENV